jgi:hypothetical protein
MARPPATARRAARFRLLFIMISSVEWLFRRSDPGGAPRPALCG